MGYNAAALNERGSYSTETFRPPINKDKVLKGCFQLLCISPRASPEDRLKGEFLVSLFSSTAGIPKKLKQLACQLIICKSLLGGELCEREGKGLGCP